nr:unnamed protein product [Spirometra erinaceieuropaei]
MFTYQASKLPPALRSPPVVQLACWPRLSTQTDQHKPGSPPRYSVTWLCATLDVLGRYIGGSGGMERSAHLSPLPSSNSISTEDSAASQEEAM